MPCQLIINIILMRRVEWLMGIKTSLIKSNNTFFSREMRRQTYSALINLSTTNIILKATRNILILGINWNLVHGLRIEYMYTFNKLSAYSNHKIEENNRKELRLFPNMAVSYTIMTRINQPFYIVEGRINHDMKILIPLNICLMNSHIGKEILSSSRRLVTK